MEGMGDAPLVELIGSVPFAGTDTVVDLSGWLDLELNAMEVLL